MSKQIDVSVLPESMLVESFHDWMPKGMQWAYELKAALLNKGLPYRPALNYPHFNDGSMTLPDGLVVEVIYRSTETETVAIGAEFNCDLLIYSEHDSENDIIAVKVLGVTPEYSEHGAQLGMKVIEL